MSALPSLTGGLSARCLAGRSGRNVSIGFRKCLTCECEENRYLAFVQAVIEAIAEPRRREILRLVRDEEMTAGKIAAHFNVTRQAISQHLRVLHDARLVSERREGTRRIYRIRPEGLTELRAFLDDFWSNRLEKLKREAEAVEKSRAPNRHRR